MNRLLFYTAFKFCICKLIFTYFVLNNFTLHLTMKQYGI